MQLQTFPYFIWQSDTRFIAKQSDRVISTQAFYFYKTVSNKDTHVLEPQETDTRIQC